MSDSSTASLSGIRGKAESTFCIVSGYCFRRLVKAVKRSYRCRYFRANLVYFVYCIVLIGVNKSSSGGDFSYNSNWFNATSQHLYNALSYVHIVNAAMYLYMWSELRPLNSLFLLPDWLNLLGAIIYLVSAWYYPLAFADTTTGGLKVSLVINQHYFSVVNYLDFLGCALELLASLGWVVQWYVDYCTDLLVNPLSCIGRGFTLDDPDLWGNVTLLLAAGHYFSYNLTIVSDPSQHDRCLLYELGDRLYALNSMCYLLCALRDSDAFFFMPTNGRLPDLVALARVSHMERLEKNADADSPMRDLVLLPSALVGEGSGSFKRV